METCWWSQAPKKPGDLARAKCFSLGFWALCVRNSLAKLTTRELGKHRVVSKHPLKPLFCAHTMIFRLRSKQMRRRTHFGLGNGEV